MNWMAPALNTVLYRFSDDEVEFILVYGRPFSPMSAWGLDGGGPMNAQQIETLIAYIKSIQIPRVGCAAGENDPLDLPDAARCPTEVQQEIMPRPPSCTVDNGTYASARRGAVQPRPRQWRLLVRPLPHPGLELRRARRGPRAARWARTSPAASVERALPARERPDRLHRERVARSARSTGIQSQGSGRMPGFGNMLTDEQIKLIVEYVRGL